MKEFEFKSKVRVAISSICNLHCKYCDNSRVVQEDRIASMEDFRRKPLSEGNVSTKEYISILRSFFMNGYDRVDFTGGEPMMNPDWDYLVIESKSIGFKSVELTTNGTLINRYLDDNGAFPQELDRLIVSIDTYDAIKYKEIVGRSADLESILQGVQRLKKCNPNLKMTANCVLCRSNEFSIGEYIDFIKKAGFDSITFLDLVVRDMRKPQEVAFFLKEFSSGEKVKHTIKKLYGDLIIRDGRHAYNVTLPNGLNISVVDTKGQTRRDAACDSCQYFCQEGFYTAKMATDGTIIDCTGAGGSIINAREALLDGTLDQKIQALYYRLANGKQGYYFDRFYARLLQIQTIFNIK